jgi:hypothetical protein
MAHNKKGRVVRPYQKDSDKNNKTQKLHNRKSKTIKVNLTVY